MKRLLLKLFGRYHLIRRIIDFYGSLDNVSRYNIEQSSRILANYFLNSLILSIMIILFLSFFIDVSFSMFIRVIFIIFIFIPYFEHYYRWVRKDWNI